MLIEESVAILNANKHRDNSDWYIHGTEGQSPQFVRSQDPYDVLEPFEATAIATAYLAKHSNPVVGRCCVCSHDAPLFARGNSPWGNDELRPTTILISKSGNYGAGESNG